VQGARLKAKGVHVFEPPAALKTQRPPREKFAASGPGSVKEPTPPGCDPANGCRFFSDRIDRIDRMGKSPMPTIRRSVPKEQAPLVASYAGQAF